MLKTRVGDEIWLISQPDHARVSGYLAAHWGGVNGFVRPGEYVGATDARRWREEVVLAIAEHDNGWWEWEAMPQIDPRDGLPLGLGEVGRRSPEQGLKRWRLGVPRLAEEHPYAALLISMHAYWLYAGTSGDLAGEGGIITHEGTGRFLTGAVLNDWPYQEPLEVMRHPLFGGTVRQYSDSAEREMTRAFLEEMRGVQRDLIQQLRGDAVFARAVEPEYLLPHFKLLQVLDAMSLLMCFHEQQPCELREVPRGAGENRVTVRWRMGEVRKCEHGKVRKIICEPFPFDCDPLQVDVPLRVMQAGQSGTELPMVRLHQAPVTSVTFDISSAAE